MSVTKVVEPMVDKENGSEGQKQLCVWLEKEKHTAFLNKARDNDTLASRLMRSWIEDYVAAPKPARQVPNEINEIIPAFVEFMQSKFKSSHLAALQKALLTI